MKRLIVSVFGVFVLAGCGATSPGGASTATTATPTITPSTDASVTAYRTLVSTNAQAMVTALGSETTSCGQADVTGCLVAANTVKDLTSKFINDLAKVGVPEKFRDGDSKLRQGLELLLSGTELQIKGINDGPNVDEMNSGTSQVNQGTALMGEAATSFNSAG